MNPRVAWFMVLIFWVVAGVAVTAAVAYFVVRMFIASGF
jgi:hypothetical protein